MDQASDTIRSAAAQPATQAQVGSPRTDPKTRQAVKDAATLTLVVVLIVLTIGATIMLLLARHRRRTMLERKRKRRRPARLDAWAESARRIGDRDREHGDDDTVDLDPGDLGPGDVGPGGPGNAGGRG